MNRFLLTLAAFLVSLQIASTASLFQEAGAEESIKNNLIEYESEFVEGLKPPSLAAKNYFNVESAKSIPDFENPYVVEIHKTFLKIKTTGLPAQKLKLNESETEGVQKLSLYFVELLNSSKLSSQTPETEVDVPNWKDLNPVLVLSNSGISLQFLNISEKEVNATEISSENRKILWDFLTKYARNIFDEKLKQLKVSEGSAEVFDTPEDQNESFAFQNFVNFLAAVMRLSVDYAETAFQGWTTSSPDVTEPEVEEKIRSSTATLSAYEEPSPFHEFPSEEFLYRRKDVDSIFYGRGVI